MVQSQAKNSYHKYSHIHCSIVLTLNDRMKVIYLYLCQVQIDWLQLLPTNKCKVLGSNNFT